MQEPGFLANSGNDTANLGRGHLWVEKPGGYFPDVIFD